MEPNKTFRLTGFSREVNGRSLVFQDTVPAPPICALCGLVPAETYTLTCTHLFCPACFAGVVQKTKSSLYCPMDDKSFRPKKALQPSSKARDYVLRLIVFCFNKTNGCSFFGTVEAMLKHFGGCVYWDLTCQLCRAPVLRSNLVSHVKAAHAKPEKRNVAPRSTSPAMEEASAAVVAVASSPVTAAVGAASLGAQPSLPSHDLLKTIGPGQGWIQVSVASSGPWGNRRLERISMPLSMTDTSWSSRPPTLAAAGQGTGLDILLEKKAWNIENLTA
ncbi:unnamed protein product [Ixodes pacificus]